MVICIGDTHGDLSKIRQVIHQYDLHPKDYVIVAGDFGFIFWGDERERLVLEELDKLGVTICFVDGNHESFTLLKGYECMQWNGGRVHRIGAHIFHLMRGQVFLIEGKRIFTMGGAASKDKGKRLKEVSWWRQEIPVGREYEEAMLNLAACDYRIDYVITHQAPKRIIRSMGKTVLPDELRLVNFLDRLSLMLDYEKWYFGHWHMDEEEIEHRFQPLYVSAAIISAGE